MPRSGFNGVDFEDNINFERLHSERLERAKKFLHESEFGALLCYDFDNIRYITGTHVGEWNRNKMNRHCLLIDGYDQPILFDPACPSKRQRVSWIRPENIMPAVGSMRGSIPASVGMVQQEVEEIISYLKKHDVFDQPLGIDIVDIPLYQELERAGVKIGDGQAVMVNARMIKTDDEIQLLKCSAAMVDAAYWDVAKNLRPGATENEMAALIQHQLFKWGAESVEFVNCISGQRGNPHSHTTSNRMIRPGELVYFDVGNVYNGYHTCYYRTFSCGRPTKAQEEAYAKALKWIRDGIDQIKPGATTADVAKVWPSAQELGFNDEKEAFLLQFVRDLGLDVVLVARGDSKQTEERIAALGRTDCRVLSIACDISDPEKVAEMKKKVDEFGGCDILINNAGIYPFILFEDLDYKMWKSYFATNVDGPYNCLQAFLPGMREKGWGRVVNITSDSFMNGHEPKLSGYISTKGAVIGLTRALASEYGPYGVTVNSVAPSHDVCHGRGFYRRS